jgi:hypothetical protein
MSFADPSVTAPEPDFINDHEIRIIDLHCRFRVPRRTVFEISACTDAGI